MEEAVKFEKIRRAMARKEDDGMLELAGKCCSGIKAVEFMEELADVIPEEVRTEEFCEAYEAALNRFRYEVAKGIGKKRKVTKAKKRYLSDFISCGSCGHVASPGWKFCPNCGTMYIMER